MTDMKPKEKRSFQSFLNAVIAVNIFSKITHIASMMNGFVMIALTSSERALKALLNELLCSINHIERG